MEEEEDEIDDKPIKEETERQRPRVRHFWLKRYISRMNICCDHDDERDNGHAYVTFD